MKIKEADIMDWRECERKFIRNAEIDSERIKSVVKKENNNFIYFLTRNPNEERMNNLPLNSDGLTFLNKFESDKDTVSINGGCMSKNIIPGCSLGGNNLLLMKCLSNVKIILDSDFAILEISLSLEFRGGFFTSKPLFLNSSVSFIGIFSSEISFGLLEKNIFFFLNEFRSVIQNRQNSFFAKLWKIIMPNFINTDPCSKQFQNLPNHYPGIFEYGFSFANFTISDDIIINFSSHRIDDIKEYLNFWVRGVK